MTAPNKLAIINVIEDFIELKKKNLSNYVHT